LKHISTKAVSIGSNRSTGLPIKSGIETQSFKGLYWSNVEGSTGLPIKSGIETFVQKKSKHTELFIIPSGQHSTGETPFFTEFAEREICVRIYCDCPD